MSIAGSQERTLLMLLAQLRPDWRRDPGLPARIGQLLARNRAFGSRDRRLYRELIYTVLRHLPWIEPLLDADPALAVRLTAWLAAATPATERFRASLLAGWPAAPENVFARVDLLNTGALPMPPASASGRPGYSVLELFPAWLPDECPSALAPSQLDALLRRAPLWLRLQTSEPDRVTAELDSLGWPWIRAAASPDAIRLLQDADITKTRAFQEGLVEVQDLGSQLLLASADITPGEHWLDACAGAGGKTLQLARLLGPSGTVDAHDVRAEALAELGRRAERAGLRNVNVRPTLPSSHFDGVLVDAPCSGSGTWRRAPHLKWITSQATLQEHAHRQAELLGRFAERVRAGGLLLYATCSLCDRENAAVVQGFLSDHPEFSLAAPARTFGETASGAGLAILPAQHDSDGFYVAHLRRRAG